MTELTDTEREADLQAALSRRQAEFEEGGALMPARPVKSDREENIAVEVLRERDRQDAKWGEQNHPDGTGPTDDRVRERFLAQTATDRAAASGTVTWRHILKEEVAEALAESDPAKLRTELVQVAAVAQQWVSAIDRRTTDHD